MLIYELDEDYFNSIQQNNQNINQFNYNNQMNNNNNQINNNQMNNNNDNLSSSNPLLMNISNIFKVEKLKQYRKMVDFQQQQQSIQNAQKQNGDILKLMNCGYFNANQINQEQNPFKQADMNFQLTFSVVPEFGDQSLDNSIKILSQVRSSHTVKMAIDNFFIKLVKPRESIKRLLLNGNILDPQCTQTLSSLNIDHNTVIKAIKSENFNELRLI